MTREHRLLMGLEDLKAVVIACKCGVRFSMSPDAIVLPDKCPNRECDIVWGGKETRQVGSDREKWATANLDLIDAIKRTRSNQKNGSFRVLLEFDDSPGKLDSKTH
jgi:hypothetical protein